MSWRYGIVKYHNKERTKRFYGIGELYFEKDPLKPFCCTAEPLEIVVLQEDLIIDNISCPDGEKKNEDTYQSIDSLVLNEFEVSLKRILKDISRYPIFDIDGPYEKEEHPYESYEEDALSDIADLLNQD
jgi:hypothetical protein